MSWAGLMGGDAPELADSPLEQARFGVGVQRLVVPARAETSLSDVLDLLAGADAEVVVLRYPADRVDWFAGLRATGREPVFADTLGYWRLEPGRGRRPEPVAGLEASTGLPEAADLDDLVADIFAGYGNHYLANPLFPAELARAGYQEWAARSLAATPPITLLLAGEPAGFATLADDGTALEIELAGVRSALQGRGLYAHLLAGAEDEAVRRGSSALVISTQGHNTNVQRAWVRYGFEPVHTFVTVHLVRAGLLG